MTRVNNISVQNNFSRGLITEATGLAFPENACVDTDNCKFNHFGIVERRPGFDLEEGFVEATETIDQEVVVVYEWKNVAGEGDITFVVVQIGNTLHFYRAMSTEALSANKHATTINLLDHDSGVATVADKECQFSTGNGRLFVTGTNIETFMVEYDSAANTFSSTAITIQIRDFTGDLADTETITSRPTSTLAGLDPNHRYNLENQGWTEATLTAWDTAQTTMPSNADVAWHYKAKDSEQDYLAAISFSDVAVVNIGNTAAPKGHFIYTLYDQDRSTNVSGATDFTIVDERVATSAFFAGRVFYSGLKYADHSSRIYFSQIVEEETQYGKCYQVNDPTSEVLFDLLPSDGGVIDILEAGFIFKLMPYLNSLLVFATNGIWAISGSEGVGFRANDYSVNKISSLNNISHTSFVDVEGTPYWWALEGIYTVQRNQQGALAVVSITDQAIREFMLDISLEAKQLARGAYDQFNKRIQWIYKSRNGSSASDRYTFDRMLTYSLINQAFEPWSVADNFGTTGVKIHGIVNVFGIGSDAVQVDVVASSGVDNVQANAGADEVIAFVAGSSEAQSVLKYFVSYDDGSDRITWGENYDTSYLDWDSFDSGTTYESFFSTGYIVRGQASRKFQQNYVNIYSDNEEETTFVIRGQWDYANASSSNRWSDPQTLTVQAGDYDYRPKRVKIRGHGKACQIRINNNGNEPFKIIGWSVFETGNQWV